MLSLFVANLLYLVIKLNRANNKLLFKIIPEFNKVLSSESYVLRVKNWCQSPTADFYRQKCKLLKSFIFQIWDSKTHTGFVLSVIVGFSEYGVVLSFWRLNLYCVLAVLCANCDFGPLHCRNPLATFSKFKSPKRSSSYNLSLKKGKSPLIMRCYVA